MRGTYHNAFVNLFSFHYRPVMKRAASPDYFSDDDEHETALVAASEEFDQIGGALPLFRFHFVPVGQRRRWRKVVRGLSFELPLNSNVMRHPPTTSVRP